MAVVLTLVQTKQIRINIINEKNKNTIKTKHNTIIQVHILPKHTPTHYKTSSNNHNTRYTPNEVVTMQSSTLSIRSTQCTLFFCPQNFTVTQFALLQNKITSHKSRQFTPHHFTSYHFTYLPSIPT